MTWQSDTRGDHERGYTDPTDNRSHLNIDPAAVLPYGPDDAPSSGYAAGVDTSRERAERADRDGTTADRQRTVLYHLRNRRAPGGLGRVGPQDPGRGLTWKELAGMTGWHHGQASGVLSVLHKAGRIARLTERRDRCFVYVLPEYVHGRETQQQGRPRTSGDATLARLIQAEAALVEAEDAIQQVRDLHSPEHRITSGRICRHCAAPLPCPTLRALDGAS